MKSTLRLFITASAVFFLLGSIFVAFALQANAGPPPCLHGNGSVIGTPGPDRLCGGTGSDIVKGKGGDDHLAGNHGADIIRGGPGNDVLLGGKGPDSFYCGPGKDAVHNMASTGNDYIDSSCEVVLS